MGSDLWSAPTTLPCVALPSVHAPSTASPAISPQPHRSLSTSLVVLDQSAQRLARVKGVGF